MEASSYVSVTPQMFSAASYLKFPITLNLYFGGSKTVKP